MPCPFLAALPAQVGRIRDSRLLSHTSAFLILEGLIRRTSGIPLSAELTAGDFTLPARLFGLKPPQNQYLKVKGLDT